MPAVLRWCRSSKTIERFGACRVPVLELGSRLKEPDTAVNAVATVRVGNGIGAKESGVHPSVVPDKAPRSQKVVGASRRCAAPGIQFVESLAFVAFCPKASTVESHESVAPCAAR